MTTEQAVKAIASHLQPHIDEIPESLLKHIEKIINRTRTIIKKEIVFENRIDQSPDLEAEWVKICEAHKLDPNFAKRGRQGEKIKAKVHFVRHILLNFKYIKIVELADFLNLHHTTIIALRDHSKVECIYPGFYQKKRYVVKAKKLAKV